MTDILIPPKIVVISFYHKSVLGFTTILFKHLTCYDVVFFLFLINENPHNNAITTKK
jgi:hypothetical protein